ncbi:regulator of chromosome condensation 1/beta-lactamase-inhibitor protein II [Thamnidium elegans]|nr:regulator of chromosome condensation 1/beta-lactamase-inhibitor protein II [Thamnidium elegans]
MLSHLKSGTRALHTSTQKTVLYGWGQTQALPLTKGHMDRVFNQPTLLRNEQDYALPKDEEITQVATGWGHSLLSNSNQVYAFGLNQSGQLGTSKTKLTMQDPVKFVACGREHSHIVTENQESTQLYSFGNNMYGQLGLGKNKNSNPGSLIAESQPTLVNFKEKIESITCGLDNTIFATKKQIFGMGWSADGQLGQGFEDKTVPSPLSLEIEIKKLSSSTDYTFALGTDGRLWTWGNSEYGQGIQGKIIDRILEPLEVKLNDVVDVAAGGPFSVILTKDGQVYTCGYGSLGLGKDVVQTLEATVVTELSNKEIIKVFATTDYAAAISKCGELYTWGLNGPSGRLGLGDNQHAFIPKLVKMDRQVIDVALGTSHAIATCTE